MNKKHIQHLYWRAGFGINPKTLNSLVGKSRFEIVDDLFYSSRRATPLYLDKSDIKDVSPQSLQMNREANQEFRKLLQKKTRDLNSAWIERLSKPKELLREKMTLFWANHFVCRSTNAVFAEQYNNTLRMLALGNFRTFVKAISREAAMIQYLNLRANRKRKPNENFARELMELFTLGRGHYTENDIKESARAFTGYDHDFYGKFQFRKGKHDYQLKTFFKRSGRFDGDDIIDIILLERDCANFICRKIYRYFVSETVNDSHINEMVNVFYPSYDIEKVMRFVFMSDWFYDKRNVGTKIKSPIEFLVGLSHVVPMQFRKQEQLLAVQRMLGQVLLFPPNVAGWKTGKNWIDSNTIILRLRLPSLLMNNAVITYQDKGGFTDPLLKRFMQRRSVNLFKVVCDWGHFEALFEMTNIEDLSKHLIQGSWSEGTENMLGNLKKESKKDYAIQLMSLPEYQMC